MDYRSTYRSLINSYYLSEGFRITFGLCLPPIIGSWLGHENIGITISIGAICVSIVDSAGPVTHRKNAMLVCIVSLFLVSALTGLCMGSPWLMGLLIASVCFIFSMIGVYGARASSIGLAALFVMIFNMTSHESGAGIFYHALLVTAGGVWYMALSLSLYSFRPYRVTRQALGDLIQATADYLLWRAAFYGKDPDYDHIYSSLLDRQISINEKQNLIRELLYKSRNLVKETTNFGRTLLIIFIDIDDLFERMQSTQVDHHLLQKDFGESPILEKFRSFLHLVADEINETGIAIQSGREYFSGPGLEEALNSVKKYFEEFRDGYRTASNIESFLILRSLLNVFEDFVSRLQAIQQYSRFDQEDVRKDPRVRNYDQFVKHQDIDAKVFLDNFNWKSNTFRHALRVTLATTTGFVVSQFLPLGHGYWILLTIIVIMKPAYGVSKKRNWDRLLGTVIGAAIGAAILYFVRDRHVLVGCMILLMIASYSFMRNRYLLFVTMMTPYILILLHLLNPSQFSTLLVERLIDTAIGSVIALIAGFLLFPDWAYRQFAELLMYLLEANKKYFIDVTSFFTGKPVDLNQYKLSRKNAYVALANVSDSLNQILAEPKKKQQNAPLYHQLLVLNYLFSSHVASLATLVRDEHSIPAEPGYKAVAEAIAANLDEAVSLLKERKTTIQQTDPFPGHEEFFMDKNNGENKGVKSTLPVMPTAMEPHASLEFQDAVSSAENVGVHQSNAETLAHEGLRQINKRVAELVTFRKKELDQGIQVTSLKTSLPMLKSVNDQFNFIWKISGDLLRSLRN